MCRTSERFVRIYVLFFYCPRLLENKYGDNESQTIKISFSSGLKKVYKINMKFIERYTYWNN